MVTDQLKRAYEAAQKLSLKDQDTLAEKILEEIEDLPGILHGFSKDGVFIGGSNVFHIVGHVSNQLDSFVLVQGQHCQAESPTFDACLGILSFVERRKDHPEKIKALEDELQGVIDRHVFSHPLKGDDHQTGRVEWIQGQSFEAPLQ